MNILFSKSKWIWLKECKANQYADFIVKFIVTEKDAKLRISADSDYEAYLNGHFVYAGQYPTIRIIRSTTSSTLAPSAKRAKTRSPSAVATWERIRAPIALNSRGFCSKSKASVESSRTAANTYFPVKIFAIGADRWKRSARNSDFLFRTIPRKRTIGRRAFRRALPSKNHANFFPAPISVLYSKSAAARCSFRRATLY